MPLERLRRAHDRRKVHRGRKSPVSVAEATAARVLAGLLAAIPAVVAYNNLSSDADRISGSHEAFADEFSTILSRQLEED